MEKREENKGKDDGRVSDEGAKWNEYGERLYPDFIKESQAAYQAAGNPALKSYTKRKKGKCIVRIAPSDVQMDCDDKTMIQPDIYVGCDKEKFLDQVYYGAPDLVIEILSPSSGKRDRGIKYRKYKKAGVREYWLVDPKAKRVTVYDFEHEEHTAVYTFNDKIPVGIWSEKCSNKYLNDGGEWFDVDLRELLE